MSGAAVALLNALDTLSSSSPSKADENEFAKLKKKFTELSSNNMEAVILHVDVAIAEELVSEIPNYQIDQVWVIISNVINKKDPKEYYVRH